MKFVETLQGAMTQHCRELLLKFSFVELQARLSFCLEMAVPKQKQPEVDLEFSGSSGKAVSMCIDWFVCLRV